jgi:hypothetical protein
MRWLFKLFKISLFTLNTFYFLLGILVLISSACLYVNPNQINELIKIEYGTEYMQLIYGMIGFSLFLNLVGLIGCTGILHEKYWILLIYFSLLFAIFGFQFFAAIYIYMQSVNYFQTFKEKILQAIKFKYGTSAVHSRALDYMHHSFKCCGWNSPKDWFESNYVDPKFVFKTNQENVITIAPTHFYKIPHSCCVNNYDLTCVLMHKFHDIGCESILNAYYNRIEIWIAWLLAILNVFQLVLLVLALYLLCMIFFNQRNFNSSSRKSSSLNVDRNDLNSIEEEDLNDNDKIFMTSFYL